MHRGAELWAWIRYRESLLAAVICKNLLGLSLADIVCVVAIFFLGEIVMSRILFRLHIREQPY